MKGINFRMNTGWLRDALGFQTKSSLARPSPELMALFGVVGTAAGESVSPEKALRVPAVQACVKVIAEAVSQLPLHLYRRTGDGGKERATDHPLYAVLHDEANPWTSAAEFRLWMQTQVLLHGNAFAWINRRDGVVVELIPMPAPSVTVEVNDLTQEPTYRVSQPDGSQRVYERADVLHLRTIGPDTHVGVSPIHLAREAIGLALGMERHGAKLFGKGARPGGVLEHPKALNGDTMKRLRESFDATHAGADNSGGTLVLEEGMSFRPLQFTSVDLQFLELRRHQIAEIARVFRVPLHMLQELERTTHNNAEHMGRQFVSLTLLPWLKLWEGAIRRSLLSPEERRDHYVEFLTDDLARADLAARFEAYAKAVTNGLLSPNEVRAAENRPPYAGGDEFRLPMNTETPEANDGDA